VIVAVLFLLATICLPAAADPLSQTRHVFINVSNTDGVKYDLDAPRTGDRTTRITSRPTAGA